MASNMNKKNDDLLIIKKLYIKDISFENLLSSKKISSNSEPAVDINVKLSSVNIENNDHELILYIKAETRVEKQIMFIIELQYAGIFELKISDEKKNREFVVEGAKILFPYVRTIITNITKDGGFNPLIIQPLDFNKIYSN